MKRSTKQKLFVLCGCKRTTSERVSNSDAIHVNTAAEQAMEFFQKTENYRRLERSKCNSNPQRGENCKL